MADSHSCSENPLKNNEHSHTEDNLEEEDSPAGVVSDLSAVGHHGDYRCDAGEHRSNKTLKGTYLDELGHSLDKA